MAGLILQKIAGARKASRAGAIFAAVLLAGVPGLGVTAQAMLAPVASEAVPAPPPLGVAPAAHGPEPRTDNRGPAEPCGTGETIERLAV